jgi:hypothetical protein
MESSTSRYALRANVARTVPRRGCCSNAATVDEIEAASM